MEILTGQSAYFYFVCPGRHSIGRCLGSPIIILKDNMILHRGAGRTHPPKDHLLLARFRTIIIVYSASSTGWLTT